jgi:Arc/MetJ-type ribon-helix-helix transcriptional regulator
MTIHLPEDLKRFIGDAVRGGHYAHEDDVIRDALIRLRQTMPQDGGKSRRRTKSADQPKKKVLTEAELRQHMLEIGLMSQLPDTDADFDDPDDQPISIKGEPLSETIIRERR